MASDTRKVVEVDKRTSFTPPQIVEAINGAYPDLKIPGNASIVPAPGGGPIEIRWKEKQ